MNKNTKKIFAREFLILLGSAALVLVGILLMYFIDSYYDNKLNDINEKMYAIVNEIDILEEKGNYYLSELVVRNPKKIKIIISETDSRNDYYEIKFLYAILKHESLLEQNYIGNYEKFEARIILLSYFCRLNPKNRRSYAEDRELRDYYYSLKERNYLNISFNGFVNSLDSRESVENTNSLDLIILNQKVQDLFERQNKIRSSFLCERNVDKVNLTIIILIFIIVYPIRIITKGIIWSIVTLKE